MVKFKSIHEALKQGYKIFRVEYDIEFHEFKVTVMKGTSVVYFYCKKLPRVLKTSNFDLDAIKIDESKNWIWIKMEMAIKK